MSTATFVAVFVPLLFDIIAARFHPYGIRSSAYSTMTTQELYRNNSTEPRNYTIIFRSEYKGDFPYAKISVDNNLSHGQLDVITQSDRSQYFQATITIPNGINVVVSFSVESKPTLISPNPKEFTFPKCITIVHIQDSEKPKRTAFAHNAVGQRQTNDRLIYFASRNVTNRSNFASSVFEFQGTDDQAISYVGFSFDSPTAVAFLNSTFILDNQFSAVVYDLGMSQFTANMSVFGYENGDKPAGFQSIVRLVFSPYSQINGVTQL